MLGIQDIMKSTLIDFNFTDMHSMFNSEMIKAICRHSSVNLLDWGSYYEGMIPADVNIIPVNCVTTRHPRLARLVTFLNMAINRVKIPRDTDKVFVLGYDVFVFAFGSLLFGRKDNIYLVHHLHVDDLKNKFKRTAFDTYKNKVHHIVLADYIKRYLIDVVGVEEKRVFVMNHPAFAYDTSATRPADQFRKRLFVGLNYSNDEKTIENIIRIEKLEQVLKKNDCFVVLKSKVHSFKSENLLVFNGPLPREQYDQYYKDAMAILVLIGSDFVNRISGTMIDALSYGKVVVGTNIPCIVAYAANYPSMFRICDSAKTVLATLVSDEFALDDNDFHRFIRENSCESLAKQLGAVFNH